MRWLTNSLLAVSLSLSFLFSNAQDSTNIEFTGYVKDLQTFSFIDNADSVFLTNLVHNRINFSIQRGDFFFSAGLRNLLYTGDQVKFTPSFGKVVSQEGGYLYLTQMWTDAKSMVFISMLDRLNAGWNFRNGSVRVGRQRINWGVNTIWNPNDIFNVYNFLNFDYSERPGNDAVKFSYNFKTGAHLEVATAPSKNDSLWISAFKYGFNKWGYDIQLIAGNYYTDIVGGLGFAGNIKDAGLKFELSYFHPREPDSKRGASVSLSSGIDYGFSSGWYVGGAFLFNSAAPDLLYDVRQLTAFTITPKRLMPARWSFLLQGNQNFSPLLSGNFTVVYSPKLNLLIILPTISYSLAEDWDIDLVLQSFFADDFQERFRAVENYINLRLRWSY